MLPWDDSNGGSAEEVVDVVGVLEIRSIHGDSCQGLKDGVDEQPASLSGVVRINLNSPIALLHQLIGADQAVVRRGVEGVHVCCLDQCQGVLLLNRLVRIGAALAEEASLLLCTDGSGRLDVRNKWVRVWDMRALVIPVKRDDDVGELERVVVGSEVGLVWIDQLLRPSSTVVGAS